MIRIRLAIRNALRASLLLLVVVASALLAAGAPLQVPAKLPELQKGDSWQQTLEQLNSAGVPQYWRLIGPIKDQNFKLYDSKDGVDADRTDDWSKLNPSEWTRPENELPCMIDLREALGGRFDVLGYAQTEIVWPEDGPALIWFDSFGRATVYLNNVKVDDGPPQKRFLDPGIDGMYPIEAQMKRGRNILKIKVGQDRNPKFSGWGFFVRVERNDLAYREQLLERLAPLYPDEAAGWRGAEARLEIARRHELAGNSQLAAMSYEKALAAHGDHANADYRLEAEAGIQRCREKRKDGDGASATWKKTEKDYRALVMNGNSYGADLLLRDYICKFPFAEDTGMALAARGALRLDISDLQAATAFFERAQREFTADGSVRAACLNALAQARSFRPEKTDVEYDHEVQAMVEGMRRQLTTGLPGDIEAATQKAASLVRDHSGALLRISDSTLFPRYIGLREYIRALLAGFSGESLALYRGALQKISTEQFQVARMMGGIPELEAVAWQFYYTPAGARALNDLGNLYMDRGAHAQALYAFKLLQRDYGRMLSREHGFTIEPALVAAKVVDLLNQDGQTAAAREALEQFKKDYGAAPMTVGGAATTGAEFARALQQKMDRQSPKNAKEIVDSDIATFGGNPARAGVESHSDRRLKSGPSAMNEILPRSACANVARDYWPEDKYFSHLQSHPVIFGDRAYISTLECVQAIDLGSGKKVWSQNWDSKGSLFDDGGRPLFTGFPVSCPTVKNRRVYVRALQGRQSSLRCYRAEKGELAWSTDNLAAVKRMVWISEPLVAYGLVIAVYLENPFQLDIEPAGRSPSHMHGVAAFDAESGELRWKRNLASGTTGMRVVERIRGRSNKEWATYRSSMQLGPPAAESGIVYTPTGLGSMAALNAFTGDVVWLSGYPRLKAESLEWGNAGLEKFLPRVLKLLARGPASPVVGEEVVVLAPKDAGGLIAFERQTGAIRWTHAVLDCRFLAGICEGNLLAVDDTVTAISMNSGKIAWEYAMPAYSDGLYAHPGYFGGLLYLPTKENLQVVDARTGRAQTPVVWDPNIGPLGNIEVTPRFAIGVNGKVMASIPVGSQQ